MPSIPHQALRALEARLDVARPEETEGAELIGFGEISLVFRPRRHPGVVLKRMAGFRSDGEVAAYVALVDDYVRRLARAGLRVAETRAVPVDGPAGPVVYVVQEALAATDLGHARLGRVYSTAALGELLWPVLVHVARVLDARDGEVRLGLDAQLSNWVFAGEGAPIYLDVTTPLVRRGEAEQLDLALLLRALPAPLGWALTRSGKARSMLDRYYDVRAVVGDVVANFIKEGRPGLVTPALSIVNPWLIERGAAPLRLDEVRADYKSDARAWGLIQGARRADRALARLTGRRYAWPLAPRVTRYPAGDAR